MAHFRKLFDERFVGAWDFEGHDDATMTIKSIGIEEMRAQDGSTTKKPVLFFEESKTGKGLVLNKTNAKTIAGMYGNDTNGWIGEKITIYATTCMAFGKEVECLRIR